MVSECGTVEPNKPQGMSVYAYVLVSGTAYQTKFVVLAKASVSSAWYTRHCFPIQTTDAIAEVQPVREDVRIAIHIKPTVKTARSRESKDKLFRGVQHVVLRKSINVTKALMQRRYIKNTREKKTAIYKSTVA